MKILFNFLVLIMIFMSVHNVFGEENKCLILLHGLARTSNSMDSLEAEFKKQGYSVWNKSYPSTEKKIKELSPFIQNGIDYCASLKSDKIYFITHSMGGILVRDFFQNKKSDPVLSKIQSVVMLSPPNHGSEIVDALRNNSLFKWYNGPAGLELGTDKMSVPNQLKPITLTIGVITGNTSSDPWFSYLFNGPNDGKVSVESAKLTEMKDFLVVPRGHTFIMNSEDVIKNIHNFFDKNKFIKD